MPRFSEPRVLARASAYIVFDHRKATVQLLHGAQVDFILDVIYSDHEVQPLPGGEYVVRPTPPHPLGVGESAPMLQYMPLHGSQDLHHHIAPDASYIPKLSLDGRIFQTMPPASGKELLRFITRHEGLFYRRADNSILRIHRVGQGPWRLLGMWRPVVAELARAA